MANSNDFLLIVDAPTAPGRSLQEWRVNGVTLSLVNAAGGITLGNTTDQLSGAAGLYLSGLFTALGATISLNASSNFNTNINTGTSTGTVGIGNSAAGALTLASGSASSFSVTGANLTLRTLTSGTLAITSAGALNFSAAAASTVTLPATANALAFDTNTLSIDAQNHRVGIGKTNPSVPLDVAGAISSSGLVTGTLGLTVTGAAVSLNASSNFNTSINTGNSTGAVSIGNNLAGALVLASASASSFTVTGAGLTFQTVTSGALALTSAGALNFSAGAASAWTLPASATALVIDTTTLTIDALNHRVGIGKTNPTVTLDVAGAVSINNLVTFTSHSTDPGNTRNEVELDSIVTLTTNSVGHYFGYAALNSVTGTGNARETAGVYSSPLWNNAGVLDWLYGEFAVPTASNGTATGVIGFCSQPAATLTGTIVNCYGIYVSNPIKSGSGAINTNYGLYIEPQTSGTANWTIFSNSLADSKLAGALHVGSILDVSSALSGSPSATVGKYLSIASSTFTDNVTGVSGTATGMAFNSIAQPTLAATHTGVVTTNAYTLWIDGPPAQGANETITHAWGLGVNGVIYCTGLNIGTTTPVNALTVNGGGRMSFLVTDIIQIVDPGDASGAIQPSGNLRLSLWSANPLTERITILPTSGFVGINKVVPTVTLDVGGTASISDLLTHTSHTTNPGSFRDEVEMDTIVTLTNSGAYQFFGYGIYNTVNGTANNTQDFAGINVEPTWSSSGTLASLYGTWSGPTTNAGTATRSMAFYSQPAAVLNGTVTNCYGVYIDNPLKTGSGVITTNYGVYIASQTSGTTNWSLYAQGPGRSYFGGRVNFGNGANVASANSLTLGSDGNVFHITGNTQINLLDSTNWVAGAEVFLIFNSTPTVKHNQAASTTFAPILLNNAADFVAIANSTLTLVYDGTNWYEKSRKV